MITDDKTKTIDISFCLPVYNVRPYLEECLNSIQSQSLNLYNMAF